MNTAISVCSDSCCCHAPETIYQFWSKSSWLIYTYHGTFIHTLLISYSFRDSKMKIQRAGFHFLDSPDSGVLCYICTILNNVKVMFFLPKYNFSKLIFKQGSTHYCGPTCSISPLSPWKPSCPPATLTLTEYAPGAASKTVTECGAQAGELVWGQVKHPYVKP